MAERSQALIMVVDDDWLNRELMESVLKLNGYGILMATNGPQALQLAAEHHPDLIFLDIRMPDMDGIEVCERLKGDPQTADIPIIMRSEMSEKRDRMDASNAGADDFITRNMPIKDLAEYIQRALAGDLPSNQTDD